MANYDFLNSPIIPGISPAAPHIHQRSMVTFIVLAIVIAIVIAIGAGVYYLQFSSTTEPAPAPVVIDQRTQMINQALTTLRSAQPASQAQVQSALKQLSTLKPVKATQSQIDEALRQLKAQ